MESVHHLVRGVVDAQTVERMRPVEVERGATRGRVAYTRLAHHRTYQKHLSCFRIQTRPMQHPARGDPAGDARVRLSHRDPLRSMRPRTRGQPKTSRPHSIYASESVHMKSETSPSTPPARARKATTASRNRPTTGDPAESAGASKEIS